MINASTKRLSSKETIRWKGKPLTLDAVRVNGQTFIVRGRVLRTAELRDQWEEDVMEPDAVIHQLKTGPLKIDFIKFWQRVPDSEPRHSYYREWKHIAAIPITTYQHWWEKQIDNKTRNLVRKAAKRGLEVREEQCSDDLVHSVMEIYNESPLRRGNVFWHYGKDFETVKRELLGEMEKSVLVAAYYGGELIGFIKVLLTDRDAAVMLILDKVSHRDKSSTNALINKVVEICAERRIPYLTYGAWRRAGHGHFQESNGFIKVAVPQYYIPLTVKGRLALSLGLHKGLKEFLSDRLPEKTMLRLLDLRSKWYARKFRTKAFSFISRSA